MNNVVSSEAQQRKKKRTAKERNSRKTRSTFTFPTTISTVSKPPMKIAHHQLPERSRIPNYWQLKNTFINSLNPKLIYWTPYIEQFNSYPLLFINVNL